MKDTNQATLHTHDVVLTAQRLMKQSGFKTTVSQDNWNRTWVVYGRRNNRTVQIAQNTDREFWYDERINEVHVYEQQITSLEDIRGLL